MEGQSIILNQQDLQDINAAIRACLNSTSQKDRVDGLDKLFSTYDSSTILSVMIESFSEERNTIARIAQGCVFSRSRASASRRIALYHLRYTEDGVARVLSLLMPIYLKLGFSLILITDENFPENSFDIPSGVNRYYLPAVSDIERGWKSYDARGRALKRILLDENIDTVCYHHSFNSLLFYDLLLIKQMGLRMILCKHEMFSQAMVTNNPITYDQMSYYPMLDLLAVLSREEELFWRTLHVNALHISNPVSKVSHGIQYNRQSKHLVWNGRIDEPQKQYSHLIPIMKAVVKKIPDCILHINGMPAGASDEKKLLGMICEAGLEGNILFHGFRSDLNDLYLDKALLLVTSAYETAPMVIIEARLFGIPVVSYEMPYVDSYKKKDSGIVCVPQGDCMAFAAAVVEILENDDYREQLHMDSLNAFDDDTQEVTETWNKIFCGEHQTYNTNKIDSLEPLYYNILSTMIFHNHLGTKRVEENEKKDEGIIRKLKVSEIRRITDGNKWHIVLYPYGKMGREIGALLKDEGLTIDYVVDKAAGELEIPAVTIDGLRGEMIKNRLFIICNNGRDIYREIRDNLYSKVPAEQVYDWFRIELEL